MFPVAQQRKMTRPPAAPDPPPEDIRPSNDTTPSYNAKENHEQQNDYEIKAFAPARATIFRFQNSPTCSNDVGLLFHPPPSSSRRPITNSHSMHICNRFHKPQCPTFPQPTSLPTIFENAPVHVLSFTNCQHDAQLFEPAPGRSLPPSSPIRMTSNGLFQRNINNSYWPRIHNRTCKPRRPDIPGLASLFTIFEDAPVLVLPSPMSHELPPSFEQLDVKDHLHLPMAHPTSSLAQMLQQQHSTMIQLLHNQAELLRTMLMAHTAFLDAATTMFSAILCTAHSNALYAHSHRLSSTNFFPLSPPSSVSTPASSNSMPCSHHRTSPPLTNSSATTPMSSDTTQPPKPTVSPPFQHAATSNIISSPSAYAQKALPPTLKAPLTTKYQATLSPCQCSLVDFFHIPKLLISPSPLLSLCQRTMFHYYPDHPG